MWIFKLQWDIKFFHFAEILRRVPISEISKDIFFKEKIQLRDNLSTFVASVLVSIIAAAFSRRMALTIAAGGIEIDSAPIGFAIGPIYLIRNEENLIIIVLIIYFS